MRVSTSATAHTVVDVRGEEEATSSAATSELAGESAWRSGFGGAKDGDVRMERMTARSRSCGEGGESPAEERRSAWRRPVKGEGEEAEEAEEGAARRRRKRRRAERTTTPHQRRRMMVSQ